MSYLEKIFGSSARMIVLENLLKNNNEFTYLSGIAKETGLSNSSVARVIEELVETDFVVEKKLGNHVKIFTINKENAQARLIIKLYYELRTLQNGK